MNKNTSMVLTLYESLFNGDTNMATAILAADLEWRFHGPPGQEHMMRVLTGVENHQFRFRPRQIAELGNWVVAEGWELSSQDEAYWVHVWVVEGEVITHLREYFNTCVTVRELGPTMKTLGDPVVWKSRDRAGRPLPGLVIAV